MELILYLLPFIAIIMIINLVVTTASRMTKKNGAQLKSVKVPLLVGGYVAVLLLSSIAVIFMPKGDLQELSAGEQLVYPPSFWEIAAEGQGVDQLDEYIVDKQEFTYDKDQLKLEGIFDEVYGYTSARILVEKKSTNDKTIEVVTYQTPSYIGSWEIRKYIEPIQAVISSDRLIINNNKTEFTYASFQTAFPFRQFEQDNLGLFNEEITRGESLLFLRVPNDLALEVNEALNVYYMDK